MKSFGHIRQETSSACSDSKHLFALAGDAIFARQARKIEKIREYINGTTLQLQKQGWKLSQCLAALDTLIGAVEEEIETEASKLCGCTLGTEYIGDNAINRQLFQL